MKSLKKMADLADRFESKLSKTAEELQRHLQPSEIQLIFKNAGLWPSPNDFSPLVAQAKVPDNVAIDIFLTVDSKLVVVFGVNAKPAHSSAQTLARLCTAKWGGPMSQALKDSGGAVTETMKLGVATFA